MKQFWKILKFELRSYFTNKIFVGITAFLAIAIAAVMFFPRISALLQTGEQAQPTGDRAVMLIVAEDGLGELLEAPFAMAFSGYDVQLEKEGLDLAKEKILTGEAECVFEIRSLTSYVYHVNTLSLYDTNSAVANEVMLSVYRMQAMLESGMTSEQIGEVLNAQIQSETNAIGKDQSKNFFYTYLMIFALYFVILMYGQMIATNVATEKSSRAMELLVTSANPTSMMFGKVIASCLAGFMQLFVVFGTAIATYAMNKTSWSDNMIVQSLFGMPVELFMYMLVFFVLGFFIYAFLYGAIGSTASKLEDINTSVMPITLLFVVAFMVVMFSMAEGNVDTPLMRICSYIPFTSPMAMFTRIAMSSVPFYEIIASIAVLIGSVVGVGVLSAKIYRVGVLLYGTQPKLGAILKAIKKS